MFRFALRRLEVARLLTETVDTTEVEEVFLLWSALTGVTVSTVDCVVDGTTGAASGSKTEVTVGAADDVDADPSDTTEAATAILGCAIKIKSKSKTELVIAVGVRKLSCKTQASRIDSRAAA